jgi:hypothetical protein
VTTLKIVGEYNPVQPVVAGPMTGYFDNLATFTVVSAWAI